MTIGSFWMEVVHILEMFSLGFHSSETAAFTGIEHSNVCHVFD